jgi:alpha-glucosidase
MSPYASLLPAYTTEQPELVDLVGEFRDLSDEYTGRVLIGELWMPIERLVRYYGVSGRGLHLPFNFHLILTAWQAPAIAQLIELYEAALPGNAWPNWVLGNHDRSRVATRVGLPQARIAGMLLLTLRGTPTLYQGDEIGMQDVPIPPEAVQDPVERNLPGLGLGRDPERTPMQWDGSPHAGFSSVKPWLPVASDFLQVNVEVERGDGRSILSLYRRLLELRRATDALAVGAYRQVHVDNAVLVYAREDLLVALNFSHEPRELPRELWDRSVVLSTYLDNSARSDRLRADEGLILR